jgi:hypothetical protein
MNRRPDERVRERWFCKPLSLGLRATQVQSLRQRIGALGVGGVFLEYYCLRSCY